MSHYPIIVIGPARSATSTVAGILHDQCGVCMGKELRAANEHNPNGYYEDMPIQRLHVALGYRKVDARQYQGRMAAIALERAARGAWGFKDPTACRVIRHVIRAFPGATYIRCVRPYAQVLASQLRIYPATRESIEAGIKRDEAMLDKHLSCAHRITTAELGDDIDAVVERLRGVVALAGGRG